MVERDGFEPSVPIIQSLEMSGRIRRGIVPFGGYERFIVARMVLMVSRTRAMRSNLPDSLVRPEHVDYLLAAPWLS